MAHKSYHVIPAPRGGWSVKKQGSRRASKTFRTKDAAVRWARSMSRDRATELYIHDKDGRIADRQSLFQSRTGNLSA